MAEYVTTSDAISARQIISLLSDLVFRSRRQAGSPPYVDLILLGRQAFS